MGTTWGGGIQQVQIVLRKKKKKTKTRQRNQQTGMVGVTHPGVFFFYAPQEREASSNWETGEMLSTAALFQWAPLPQDWVPLFLSAEDHSCPRSPHALLQLVKNKKPHRPVGGAPMTQVGCISVKLTACACACVCIYYIQPAWETLPLMKLKISLLLALTF